MWTCSAIQSPDTNVEISCASIGKLWIRFPCCGVALQRRLERNPRHDPSFFQLCVCVEWCAQNYCFVLRCCRPANYIIYAALQLRTRLRGVFGFKQWISARGNAGNLHWRLLLPLYWRHVLFSWQLTSYVS